MQLWETTERFGMKLRPELVLLQKTMVQAEGVGRALDPNLNIWDAARPIVEAWIRRELGPPATARRAIEDAAKGLAALRKLPELTEALEAFLAKAGRGRA
jgi:ubiquinone biosynthesis protein